MLLSKGKEMKVMKHFLITLCVLILSIVAINTAFPASYEKAELYDQHGLIADAKRELIDIISSQKSPPAKKAKAYYLLGGIAFDENRISAALSAWQNLLKKYPKSKEAQLVKDRVSELSEIIGEVAKEKLKNVVAQSYLRHADFWSEDKENKFMIDSSWISNVEAAIKWYDKTIKEFPGSKAAEIAYKGKMKTLLGWKERGQYGSKYGIKKNFIEYMPQLIETFKNFEKEFPKAFTLQAFRYQIAQAYWANKSWGKTREWLRVIIEKSGGKDSFYKDAAERRMKKIEY